MAKIKENIDQTNLKIKSLKKNFLIESIITNSYVNVTSCCQNLKKG